MLQPIFDWICWYSRLTLLSFFLKFKVKINWENKIRNEDKFLKKFWYRACGRYWDCQRYGMTYDVGYDIQSLNMAVCFEILLFWTIYVLRSFFFFYSSQKPHSNHVFPLFNHSSYVINNRWHHILEPPTKSWRFVFWTARLRAWKNRWSTMPKCSNVKKSILEFSSPLILQASSQTYSLKGEFVGPLP